MVLLTAVLPAHRFERRFSNQRRREVEQLETMLAVIMLYIVLEIIREIKSK